MFRARRRRDIEDEPASEGEDISSDCEPSSAVRTRDNVGGVEVLVDGALTTIFQY